MESNKIYLRDDMNGNPIYVGDFVKTSDSDEIQKIEWGSHRELFGFGKVYGYYVPDYCIKIKQ